MKLLMRKRGDPPGTSGRAARLTFRGICSLCALTFGWLVFLHVGLGQTIDFSPNLDLTAHAAVQAHVEAGEAAERNRQLLTAESDYRAALEIQPDDVRARQDLAGLFMQEHLPAAAVTLLKQAVRANPDDTALSTSLAEAYLVTDQNQDALLLFQSLAQKEMPDKGAVWINLGTALTRLDRYQEAVVAFRNALSYASETRVATLSLAKALITLGDDPHAILLLQPFVGLHPSEAEAHTLLGIALEDTGQFVHAEQQLRYAVTLQNSEIDFDTQYHLGTVLRSEQKLSEAVEHLCLAVAQRPNSQKAHFQLARAYRAARQMPDAENQEKVLAQLEESKALEPQLEVLSSQAAEAEKVGDLKKAAALYRQIQTLHPSDGHAAYDLALIDEKQQNRAAERAVLEQAVVGDQGIALVHSQLGFLDAAEGKRDDAIQQLSLALQLDPECVEALGNMGVLQAQMGNLDTAAHLLALAVVIDTHFEKGFLNWGLVLAAQGKTMQSIRALQQAKALSPSDPAVQRALQSVDPSSSSQTRTPYPSNHLQQHEQNNQE